jgi:nickel-type superoxide dismutase maturation protease
MSHARHLPVRLVVVEGTSMEPALQPGDRLLVVARRPRVGDVVALQHDGRVLVKRVAAIDGRHVTVHGDNADASTDSRSFGAVSLRSVLGRAVYRYAPRQRAGRIPLGS